MALPIQFSTSEEYFQEAMSFLQEYSYLYKHANTQILIENVLDEIEMNNLEELNIFKENFNLRDNNNLYIKRFFEKLDRLAPFYNFFFEDVTAEDATVPLSPKKMHEIIYLAREIKNVCETVDCSVVVDFGSGLGYLDQKLHETTNYRILGIESNENNYVAAKKRQRKYYNNSLNYVKYIKHRITVESCGKIEEYLSDKFGKTDFCITGLHACADLTVDALNIFLNMAAARCLVIMPCCYHKMEEINGNFTNFPLSDCLKRIFNKYQANLNVPFLRLGAQPPNWKENLEDLVFNLLSRAVLQLYAYRHNCKLKRNKRKAVKTKSLKNNFESYARDATFGFNLTKNDSCCDEDKDENIEINLEELNSTWRQLPEIVFKKAGIYILLQSYLQRIIENFILYDRLVYLNENGLNRCEFKKIFDDHLSPRCLALVALK